jgi:hypothetical protein
MSMKIMNRAYRTYRRLILYVLYALFDMNFHRLASVSYHHRVKIAEEFP